jgi:hypothetical protein
LAEDATMRDVLLAVRADEANHRDVNHTLSSIKGNDVNPYIHHETKMDPRDQDSSASLSTAEVDRQHAAGESQPRA